VKEIKEQKPKFRVKIEADLKDNTDFGWIALWK
jgi:hypothetical protein